MSPFDLAGAPLARGTTLIEASAGTGKTYTIAGLCVRLIAEEGLTIDQLLVTTFTIPATAELRDRIRRALRAAHTVLTTGECAEPYLAALTARAGKQAVERIESALRNFDEAVITTMHGFCQRVLKDRAFESGTLFDSELLADQSALLAEVADDYWRTQFYGADALLTGIVLAAGFSREGFVRLLSQVIARPRMVVRPPADPAEFQTLRAAAVTSFAALRECWTSTETEIRACFAKGSKRWAKQPCSDHQEMARLLDAIGASLAPGGEIGLACGALEEFTSEAIAASTRKGGCAPALDFFVLSGEFCAAQAAYLVAIQADFLAWAHAELARRKHARNVVSFDDLLTRLDDALAAPGGESLAAQLRQRFRAALIDEFQDTDPVQEAIFERVFGTAKQGWLFLIGDPKQAIYAFRGADVFTYCAAAARAEHRFTLGENFRSGPRLVQAVNALFGRVPDAFVLPDIQFLPASAAKANRPEKPSPFRLQVWSADNAITIGTAEERLPGFVSEEIVKLLAGAPLKASDFAVLVATNPQARAVQAALRERGLPAVLLGNANVFKSEEALELRAILAAVAEPAREPLLRAALATTTLGASAPELEALGRDVRGWETRLLDFQRWYERWRREGFIQMFRELLRDAGVRPRLLALPDGERRLTNLLHLAELLHAACAAQQLGFRGLVKWLAEQTAARGGTPEEHELRLESDADAVHVVTVHKSKGLEYNVVFCPFAWRGADLRKDESITFHDPDAGQRLTLDLGSRDVEAAREHATRESLAEDLRLLYVAVTRAKERCHVIWGRFHKCENSAANWLLFPEAERSVAGLVEHVKGHLVGDAAQALADSAGGTIAVEEVGELPTSNFQLPTSNDRAVAPGAARVFGGRIARDWRVASFSSLTAGREEDAQDFDRVVPPREDSATAVARGIHAFPRGLKAGVCLHEIFEQLDFQDDDAIEPFVARRLASFGFSSPDALAAVTACVRATLRAPLAPGLALAQVPGAARLVELEFHLPMSRLEAAELTRIFGEAPAAVGRLQFEPQRGILKGYLDLVFEHAGRFYIVDWKSNWLGPDSSAYTPEALAAEMTRHHYVLQYHLYLVALHRYLARRVPDYDYERHFGGVFYVFLRGVEAVAPGRGIFHDRPARAVLERLAGFFEKS